MKNAAKNQAPPRLQKIPVWHGGKTRRISLVFNANCKDNPFRFPLT